MFFYRGVATYSTKYTEERVLTKTFLQTESMYSYTDNKEHVHKMCKHSEQWYEMHQEVLMDTFQFANPMIFYNNHGDFQQTNAISSTIGVGTGGVTEALKNRVILPYTFTNQQTHHVLGHELVHAFQYNMANFVCFF